MSWMVGVHMPAEATFSLLYNFQIEIGAHSASYTMATGAISYWSNAAGK
jgi:hypothetical protein